MANGHPIRVQDFALELDAVPRKMKVRLRTIDLAIFSAANQAQSKTPMAIRHWQIIFYFPPSPENQLPMETILLFEATRENGQLVPYLTMTDYQTFAEGIDLGKVTTSPAELLQFAKSSDCVNGRYNLLTNNCQTWIKELIRRRFYSSVYQNLLIETNPFTPIRSFVSNVF